MVKQLSNPLKSSSGAVLVVALVMLAVISVLGIANMKSTTLEMRMVGSMANRNAGFALVDAALMQIERNLETVMNVERSHMWPSCGSNCFTEACSEGRCFDGEYLVTDRQIDCQVADSAGTTQRSVIWQDTSLWSDGTRHATVLDPVEGEEIKYIVEFLCYAASGTLDFDALSGNENNGIGLFRITAFYEGSNSRAPVMLQSTYTLAGF